MHITYSLLDVSNYLCGIFKLFLPVAAAAFLKMRANHYKSLQS